MLRALFRDWSEAPISGTLLLLLVALAIYHYSQGDTSTGDHRAIMAMLVSMGRKL